MEWVLRIIACFLLLLCTLLLCNVRVKIYYSLEEKHFSLSIFGITLRKTKKTVSEASPKNKKSSPRGFVAETLKHAKTKKLEIDVTLGTGDAMADVLIIQLLRSVLYSFCTLRLNAEKLVLNIVPCFEKQLLKARVEFIFSVKIIKIIEIYIRRAILSRKANTKEGN